jgi:hypothetical protein
LQVVLAKMASPVIVQAALAQMVLEPLLVFVVVYRNNIFCHIYLVIFRLTVLLAYLIQHIPSVRLYRHLYGELILLPSAGG